MSTTGKNTLSIRRKDVAEQKSIAVGFKKIQFAHKATLGDTKINLSSLVLPTEMSGFTNPSPAEILQAQISFYRKNLTLISSIKGVLIDYMSYSVDSATQISFVNFTAEDGEIFTGVIDHNPRTGIQLVDAAPLVSTGELAIAATDFNVGQLFEVNKYSSSKVGAVIVYRNGVQQFRNTSNSSTNLDGNYYEVNNGSGTGQIIRFNTAPSGSTDSILVVSNGLMAYNPDGSALQRIEAISGKIDSMVPTLADLAGVPQSTFGGVSNVDLKSFGDSVLSQGSRITNIETIEAAYTAQNSATKTPAASNTQMAMTGNSITIPAGQEWELSGTCVFSNGGTSPAYTAFLLFWSSTNGDDATTSSPANPTNLLAGYGATNIPTPSVGQAIIQAATIRVGAGTVFLVPYATMTTAANARVNTYINAKRIK
jgi:hypothetical protein